MRCRSPLMRISVSSLFLLSWLILSVPPAPAQESYPNRPITLTVGYGAGGGTDISARTLSDLAAKILGQPIVVVNKPGGTSSVSLSALKSETPDGYTIGIMPSGGIMASLLRKLPYDVIKDFTPIMQYGAYQDGLAVRADSPWKTLKEFLEYAKNNPGKVRYASSGVGTPEVSIMETIAKNYGIQWLHIPYDTASQSAAVLLGGHVDAVADSSACWKPHVDSGQFRLLATFHEKRMNTYPDVPTFMELGYNMKAASLICIVGPQGLPAPIVQKLHDAFKRAMQDPTFVNTMDKIGYLVIYRDAQDLKKYIQQIVAEEGEMIQRLGLRK